jgi:hypothetical protein
MLILTRGMPQIMKDGSKKARKTERNSKQRKRRKLCKKRRKKEKPTDRQAGRQADKAQKHTFSSIGLRVTSIFRMISKPKITV